MKCSFWKCCTGLALAAVVVVSGVAASAQDIPARVYSYRVTKKEPDKAAEYWIGVQLAPLDEVTLAQLKLKQGVVATGTVPESPAAKAGVEKNDVLLKFGETEIAAPADLIEAVKKAKEIETELTVLRRGEKATIKVTPTRRPEEQEFAIELAPEETRRLESWVRKLGKAEPGTDPIEMFFMRPGVVLQDRLKAIEYPKDLSISVDKQGNEPAKVKIKKGEKVWETTGDKLGDLPEEVRPFVEHLLGGGFGLQGPHAVRLRLDGVPGEQPRFAVPVAPPVGPMPLYGLPSPKYTRVAPADRDQPGLEAVQKQLQDLVRKVEDLKAQAKAESPLEKMKREMDQLRKELDELRRKQDK